MIDASKLPRVPNELLQQEQQRAAGYARAPAAPGESSAPVRPDATQRGER